VPWRHLLCAPSGTLRDADLLFAVLAPVGVSSVHPGIGQPIHTGQMTTRSMSFQSSSCRRCCFGAMTTATRRTGSIVGIRSSACHLRSGGGATGGADALLLDPRGDCAGRRHRGRLDVRSGCRRHGVRRAVRVIVLAFAIAVCSARMPSAPVGSVESSSQLLLSPLGAGPAIHRHGAGRIVSCMARSVCPLPAVSQVTETLRGLASGQSAARVWP